MPLPDLLPHDVVVQPGHQLSVLPNQRRQRQERSAQKVCRIHDELAAAIRNHCHSGDGVAVVHPVPSARTKEHTASYGKRRGTVSIQLHIQPI